MSWNSKTFKRRENRRVQQLPEITILVNRHRAAMDAVIREAAEITKDRIETTRDISDPNLRQPIAR